MKLSLNRWLDVICIIAAILVAAYVVLRAINVPLYSDEVFTFYTYIQQGDFMPFKAHWDANNHVLNSALSWAFYSVFGSGPLALRLANVLAFAVYLVYAWKIKQQFKSAYVGFFWFITMIASHYFVSFFQITRGYGLSMAFFTGGLYYLIKYYSENKSTALYSGLVFNILALWANLSLMVPVLVISSVFLFRTVKNFTRSQWLMPLIIIVIFIVPLQYAVKFSLALKEKGLLYQGEGGDFLSHVINELSGEFAESPWNHSIYLWPLVAVYALAAVFIAIKKKEYLPHIHIILWGIVIGTILLHYIMGVNYPRGRTGIHFFPIFMLGFYSVLDRTGNKWMILPAAVPALMFSVHMIKSLNLTHTYHWKVETVPGHFYNKLEEWKNKTGIPPTISCHGLLCKGFNYHDLQHEGAVNTAQESGFPSNVADFMILNFWNEGADLTNYDTVAYNETTGVTLMGRREPYKWTEMDTSIVWEDSTLKTDYVWIAEFAADSFINKPFSFDARFTARAGYKPVIWSLVFGVQDSVNNWQSFTDVMLQMVKPDLTSPSVIHRRQYIDRILPGAKKIHVFLWQKDTSGIHISDLKFKFFTGGEKNN